MSEVQQHACHAFLSAEAVQEGERLGWKAGKDLLCFPRQTSWALTGTKMQAVFVQSQLMTNWT